MIRRAVAGDEDAIWSILEPVIRAGEAYALPCDMDRSGALDYWYKPPNQVFVAEIDGETVGTYFIRPNAGGGGACLANCGYATASARRNSGIAAEMCRHSLAFAARSGYRGVVYNYVIASNDGAVHLWRKMGFREVGRVPEGFRRPDGSFSDVLIMYRSVSAGETSEPEPC